jgi:hypothetical protein
MSARLDRSWRVIVSHETRDRTRCVDLFVRPDGTFGFEEFRKDPEDMGAWTPVSHRAGSEYPTEADAVDAALRAVPWLGAVIDG